MRKRLISFLFVVSISCFMVFGQVRQLGLPPINNYTKQDYQAETQNWAATEDIRGLIYFGNNAGLLEFDGNNWKNFPLPNRSIVRAIAVDGTGRIFVGGQDELGYFQGEANGALKYHSLLEWIPEAYLNFEDVWKIVILGEEIFWCTQAVIFHQKGDQFTPYPASTRFDQFFACRDQLYVSEFEKGIHIWKGNGFESFQIDGDLAEEELRAILPHKDGGLLFVTSSDGIFLQEQNQLLPWADVAADYLRSNRIYCALQLKNGSYAIGTSHNGLVILDENGVPERTISKAMGLLNNSILSMHEDHSANLWLGLDNGISHIEVSSPFSLIDSRLGLKGTAHAAIVDQDKLYLATNQGVYFQNWTNPPIPLYPGRFQLVKNTKGVSWNLGKLDNTLLAGKHRGSFVIEGDRARQVSNIPGAWEFMELDEFPNLAIGGTYTGLVLYEKREDGSWRVKTTLEGFEESSRVIEQGKEGNIWISHPYRGVYRVQLGEAGESIQSVHFYNSEDGLPSDLFINVCKIQGEIFFTTEKGVYVFEEETEQFSPHAKLNELLGPQYPVHRIIEDEIGNVWFSAGEEFGMLWIRDRMMEKEIRKFSFNRLQKSLVKGFEHIYAFDEDHVFIGIDEGFILYNPIEEQETPQELRTYIREVFATEKQDSLIFGGTFVEEGQLKHSQPEAQIPDLPYTVNDFRISYSAAFFEDINTIQYQFHLEGEDEAWSPWTNKTEKEYTNLAPGVYTFQVKAKTIYGLESEIASYQFSIQAPWYKTIWARIVYLVIGLIVLWSIIRVNANRIQKTADIVIQEQAETIERKEAEFQAEVQRSEAEIIRLQNEKLEAEVNHKNQELASYAMHLVQKGEILQKLKQELGKIKKNVSGEEEKRIDGLIKVIRDDMKFDKNWEQFEYHFDKVHNNFLQGLREKYPMLTPKDQKLCAYLRMNLSTKEIAPLMNISVRGVEISRYRLRKKMNLPTDTNLNEFMMAFL